MNMNQNDTILFNLPITNGILLFSCKGSFPNASRCSAIIYRSNARINIETIGNTSGIELSINADNKLQVKYTYSSADTESMSLFVIHEFI